MLSEDDPGDPVRTVVVTYRRPAELARILGHLADQTLAAERTLVVDNDPDGGAAPLCDLAGEIDYVSAGTNLGPAGGFALGIDRAVREGYRGWVLCVDDDNYPPDNSTVKRLHLLGERARQADPRVAGVGLAGAAFDRTRGRIRRIPDAELGGLHDVDHVPGNQYPLYRSEALREVGAHDPSLFFGYEELDLGLRLRRAGWRLLVDGDELLRLRRRYGTTGGGVSRSGGTRRPEVPWRRYYSSRNLIRISRSHCSWVGVVRVTVAPLARGLIDLIRFRPGSRALLWASIRGVVDGWRGRTGRTVEPS